MLLRQLDDSTFLFWCPGCDDSHVVPEVGTTWTFNNNLSSPKFHPSVYTWDENKVCHLFITDGKLLFLPDCSHDLAEKTVPMANLPDFLVPEPETVPEEVEVTQDDLDDGYYYPALFDLDDEQATEDDPFDVDDLSDSDLYASEGEFEAENDQNPTLWDENDA